MHNDATGNPRGAGSDPPDMPIARNNAPTGHGGLWLALGLALVALALAILEFRQPYYFCQDDVLVNELPSSLFACRSVWHGVLPEYNPYNLMGTALLSTGAGQTYPPLYLAYAVARHVLGNEYATANVFAALHLLAGFAITFAVGRRLGFSGPVACLVGLSLVLSGAVLIIGRCWHAFLLVVVFQPLLVLAADRLRAGPVGWRWATATGLALGLYYHCGFPQLWLMGVFFFVLHLGCLWVWRVVPFRRLLCVIPALLLAAGVMFPLFFQQWRLARDMGPYGDKNAGVASVGVAEHIESFFVPYPLCQDELPNGWGSLDCQYGGHFYYCGTLLTALFVVALGDWLVGTVPIFAGSMRSMVAKMGLSPSAVNVTLRRPRGTHVWTCCALVAFVLCLGDAGQLWRLVAKLPGGLNNHPFRVMPLFVLYSSLAGGMMLERLLDHVRRPQRGTVPIFAGTTRSVVAKMGLSPLAAQIVTLGLLALGCLLLMYHVGCCRGAFYTYGFRPYPPLPDNLAAILREPSPQTPYRSVYSAPQRSIDPGYAFCLPHSLPTLYELPAVFGYDPLFQNKAPYRRAYELLTADMASGLRAYGVRWCLVQRPVGSENDLSPGSSRILEQEIKFGVEGERLPLARAAKGDSPIFADHRCAMVPAKIGTVPLVQIAGPNSVTEVRELAGAAGLCFRMESPERPLPVRLDGRGIHAELGGVAAEGSVVVNFLYYPSLHAYVDGQLADITVDRWGRMLISAAAGSRQLDVLCQPEWSPGLLRGAALALLGVLGMLFLPGRSLECGNLLPLSCVSRRRR